MRGRTRIRCQIPGAACCVLFVRAARPSQCGACVRVLRPVLIRSSVATSLSRDVFPNASRAEDSFGGDFERLRFLSNDCFAPTRWLRRSRVSHVARFPARRVGARFTDRQRRCHRSCGCGDGAGANAAGRLEVPWAWLFHGHPAFARPASHGPSRARAEGLGPPPPDRLGSPRNRFVSLTRARPRSRPRSRAPAHTPRIAPRLTRRVRAPRPGRTLEPRA